MSYVIDASVAIKWFVKEKFHEEALWLTDRKELLRAPDLIANELTSIAWKKCLRGEVTASQAEFIVLSISRYVPILQPSSELAARALGIALALRHPVYDCFYLACAESTDTVFITADLKLCRILEGTRFASLVCYVGDPSFPGTVH